jgi:hypothetical protein
VPARGLRLWMGDLFEFIDGKISRRDSFWKIVD